MSQELETHEAEMHQFDEDVRQALWGPVKPVTGIRDMQSGLIGQVDALTEKERSGGLKAHLGVSDKLLIAFFFAIAEAIRLVLM